MNHSRQGSADAVETPSWVRWLASLSSLSSLVFSRFHQKQQLLFFFWIFERKCETNWEGNKWRRVSRRYYAGQGEKIIPRREEKTIPFRTSSSFHPIRLFRHGFQRRFIISISSSSSSSSSCCCPSEIGREIFGRISSSRRRKKMRKVREILKFKLLKLSF